MKVFINTRFYKLASNDRRMDPSELHLSSHRDGVLKISISVKCLVVMVGCDNKHIFPTFSKAAPEDEGKQIRQQGLYSLE
jgi:hypothetical protein